MHHDTMHYAFETCYDYNLVRPVLSYNDDFNICLLLSATVTVVDYYSFYLGTGDHPPARLLLLRVRVPERPAGSANFRTLIFLFKRRYVRHASSSVSAHQFL